MNRRKIFAWIAGLFGAGMAKAQVLRSVYQLSEHAVKGDKYQDTVDGKLWEFNGKEWRPANVPRAPFLDWKRGKAKNNQCPVCGTIAEPYKADTRFCGDYNIGQQEYALGMSGCDPKHIVTRCMKCNAAFWQTAG